MASEPRPITELSEQALYGALRYSFITLDEFQAEMKRRNGGDFFSATDPNCPNCKALGLACIEHEDDGATPQVTIEQLAMYRGLKVQENGSYSGADIAKVGLALLGGCEICAATIAAYNAYPSHSGNWRCEDCIGDTGWTDVAVADRSIFAGHNQ